MKSDLFAQANLEVQTTERFTLQNPRMLEVTLGAPVLTSKGVMIAYQGQVTFEHESAGSIGKLMKKGGNVAAAAVGGVILDGILS